MPIPNFVTIFAQRMDKIPDIFFKPWTHVWYVLFAGLFFLLFALLYTPLGMEESLDMGRGIFHFNVTIMSCIVMGSIALCRAGLSLMHRLTSCSWWGYIVYCLGELTVTTFFLALYVTLMRGGTPYFGELSGCAKYSFGILVFPHLILTLILDIMDISKRGVPVESNDLVRFHDSHRQLKLVVSGSAILYISAEENYIRIHWQDVDGVKDYQLRSSMKAIEKVAQEHSLFRCHRSYYINPKHVKALRKDKNDQIVAELDTMGINIPVSRRIYSELSSLI